MRRMVYRFGPSLAAAMVYVLLVAVWRCWRPAYESLIGLFDATPHRPPFGDLVSILQAGACWRQGMNVFVANPCMNGGTFNYSPFMLRSLLYPFGPADGIWLGLLIAAAFITACACLPPARSAWQLAGRCLALCSGMVMYALEAANVDAVIFVLLAGGVWLLRACQIWSLAAYGVFAFAGALKFYPAVLLGLMLRESRARLALVAGVVLAGAVLFLVHFGRDSQIAVAGLPAGLPYRGGFSAMNIPFGLALLVFSPVLTLDPTPPDYFTAIAAPHFAQYVLLGTWGLIALALLAAWRLAPGYEAALARLDDPRRLFLLAGAMLIAFCFLAAENYDYRGIFLLFALPAVQEMAVPPGNEGVPARLLALVVLVLLWEAPLRQALGMAGLYPRIFVWLLRDGLWWCLVVNFAAFVFAQLRTDWRRLTAPRGAMVLMEPGI
ncbi:MAG TPA: hypothetical protein VMJ64_10640 [Anaerolineales bacterium]|nr:hypothetical protein [Anaerolineales bacterium]